ncbi:MAG: Rho termination factor N-terminal domain-containing protein, partial [Dehalococcoidia bacterium]|nr:Rho termination factor N-terminal domain-containing protein [Dehalococcoidia bacterium]
MNLSYAELEAKTREELLDLSKEQNIPATSSMKKQDLVMKLLQVQAEQQGLMFLSLSLIHI